MDRCCVTGVKDTDQLIHQFLNKDDSFCLCQTNIMQFHTITETSFITFNQTPTKTNNATNTNKHQYHQKLIQLIDNQILKQAIKSVQQSKFT